MGKLREVSWWWIRLEPLTDAKQLNVTHRPCSHAHTLFNCIRLLCSSKRVISFLTTDAFRKRGRTRLLSTQTRMDAVATTTLSMSVKSALVS